MYTVTLQDAYIEHPMQTASLQSVPVDMSGVASRIYSTFRYVGSTAASVMLSLQLTDVTNIVVLVAVALLGIFISRSFSTI